MLASRASRTERFVALVAVATANRPLAFRDLSAFCERPTSSISLKRSREVRLAQALALGRRTRSRLPGSLARFASRVPSLPRHVILRTGSAQSATMFPRCQGTCDGDCDASHGRSAQKACCHRGGPGPLGATRGDDRRDGMSDYATRGRFCLDSRGSREQEMYVVRSLSQIHREPTARLTNSGLHLRCGRR